MILTSTASMLISITKTPEIRIKDNIACIERGEIKTDQDQGQCLIIKDGEVIMVVAQ